MNQDLCFGLKWARKATLQWFSKEPTCKLDFMPGSTSHLTWQIGHIYVIAENINEALGFPRNHSEKWASLFQSGTKPNEMDPSSFPKWDGIITSLRSQEMDLLNKIQKADQELLDSNPKPAGHRPDTVRGWITHTIRHEAIHCCIARIMKNYHHANPKIQK